MVSMSRRVKKNISIEIRDASINDVDDIWEIFNMVVDEGTYLPVFSQVANVADKRSWFYDLITNGDFCIVAVMKHASGGETVLGQVTVETSTEWDGTEHVGILGILVHPSYRNMGVGRALMEAALEEAVVKGKKKITLSVFHTNPRAIKLYESLGFEIVGRRKRQFNVNDTYVDEVLMEIWVPPPDVESA